VNAFAFPGAAASCAECNSTLPAAARFCPACGVPLAPETVGTMLSGPSAAARRSVGYADARWFGVGPASVVLAVSVCGLAVAIAFLAVGQWPAGLIAGGFSVLLFIFFAEVARRKPDHAVSEWAAATLTRARGRLGSAIEMLAVQARAARERTWIMLELRRLDARRRSLLTGFGKAVYEGGDPEAAREGLRLVDARIEGLRHELETAAARAHARIDEARLAVQDTQMVTRPEPYPPPDEGNPPGPVILPEPAPPPDEGTPPEPDPVPTPGPEGDPVPPAED
jgi:hypothetical protein